jgi:putative transposase
MLGAVESFVLFFIHIGSCRLRIAGMSANPDAAWVTQQARNVAIFFAEQPQKPTILLRDHDDKFGEAFDAVFETLYPND